MRIYLDMVGCRVNQAEIETMARQFRVMGHEISPSLEDAELVVINTCTVTSQAAADSRSKIRQVANRGVHRIFVTGCWATLEPLAAASFPNVERVVQNSEKEALVSEILQIPQSQLGASMLERKPLPGARSRRRAFIKVQDGCNNCCTYCAAALARGPSQSRSLNAIKNDIQASIAGGTKEIVITGVHLGSWGQDLNLHLGDLIKTILSDTDIPRLRLSSLEPWNLQEDFFDLWKNERLCRHLHMPLQSGSAGVLRRMFRKNTPESYRTLVLAIRKVIPDAAITTDVMVGFPGETEVEFNETLKFVQNISFAGGHIFPYSARPGTAAAGMADQIPSDIRKVRSSKMRNVFSDMAGTYRRKFIGTQLSVLWESGREDGETGYLMSGLTDNYLRVEARASESRLDMIDQVDVFACRDDVLLGIIH